MPWQLVPSLLRPPCSSWGFTSFFGGRGFVLVIRGTWEWHNKKAKAEERLGFGSGLHCISLCGGTAVHSLVGGGGGGG